VPVYLLGRKRIPRELPDLVGFGDEDEAIAYAADALANWRQTEKVLSRGDACERKRLMRAWVQEMKLAPERLEVEITYRIPEPIMNRLGSGGRIRCA
jgi:hypothetical protein